MTEEWEREQRERSELAKKTLAEYRASGKKPDAKNPYGEIVYIDRVSDTEKAHTVFMTCFRVDSDGTVYMHKSTEKRQKFLVVTGPLAGKRIQDNNPDYLLFNASGSWRAGKKTPEKCVLVHKSAFK